MVGGKNPAVYLKVYETCFTIAAAVALVSFLLAVFLFIRLDIWGILRRRGGRLRKRTLRKRQRHNPKTGPQTVLLPV
ncbi:MAG: hypothetical protein ACSW8H_04000, partial [bacterium]